MKLVLFYQILPDGSEFETCKNLRATTDIPIRRLRILIEEDANNTKYIITVRKEDTASSVISYEFVLFINRAFL